jgi:hypothetical protein
MLASYQSWPAVGCAGAVPFEAKFSSKRSKFSCTRSPQLTEALPVKAKEVLVVLIVPPINVNGGFNESSDQLRV